MEKRGLIGTVDNTNKLAALRATLKPTFRWLQGNTPEIVVNQWASNSTIDEPNMTTKCE